MTNSQDQAGKTEPQKCNDPIETTDPAPELQVKLPDRMPEAWLVQLRDKKRDHLKTLLTSLISSCVIAAVITGVVNYRLEAYKKQAAQDLESYKKPIVVQIEEEKIKLQNRNAELAAKKAAFDAVKTNFLKFVFDLEQYIVALEAASQMQGIESFRQFSEQKLDDLVSQMKAIATSAKNEQLKEIDDNIDHILESTGLILNGIQSPNDCPKLKDQYKQQLQPMIEKVRQLFTDTEKEFVL